MVGTPRVLRRLWGVSPGKIFEPELPRRSRRLAAALTHNRDDVHHDPVELEILRRIDPGHAAGLQRLGILVRDDAAQDQRYVA